MKNIWLINQYASTPESGIGGRHYYLARELAKKGYQVIVIAASYHHLLRKLCQQKKAVCKRAVDGFTFATLKMPQYPEAHHPKRILNWFRFAWQLTLLPREKLDAPDVIICSSPSLISYLGASYLKKYYRCPLIFEVRDIWPLSLIELGNKSRNHPFIRFLQKIEDLAYKNADKVISNLPLAYKHMQKRGMPKSKFAWIANGYCTEEINQKTPLTNTVLAQIPKNKFIVGYCGTLGLANNMSLLIDAAKQIENPLIHFVVIGDGPQKEMLVANATQSKLTNITFLPRIDKTQIYSALDRFDACFIAWNDSSLYQFGIAANKIPEYLAAGKAVINAYLGEGDLISKVNAGFLIRSSKPKDVAVAILKLYHITPKERQQLGDNGKRFAQEHLDYGKLADKLIDVINQCCHSAKSEVVKK